MYQPAQSQYIKLIMLWCSDDSHLHFEVGPDGACGQPRFWARCPLLWSGCRLTHGVRQGRVGFEVRLERKLEEQAGLRVGWSVADTSLLLGKDPVHQSNCSSLETEADVFTSGFMLSHHQVRISSPLLMMDLVRRCQVGRKSGTEKLSQRGTSSAATL